MRLSNMIQAVDAHACGEHGRVIVGGVLDVPGATMFDKMQYLQTRADGLRKRMLRGPRGYPAANNRFKRSTSKTQKAQRISKRTPNSCGCG